MIRRTLVFLLAFLMIFPAFAEVPEYAGEPRTPIQDASFVIPTTNAGILYFPLDNLGRAVGASGIIGPETVSTAYKQNTQNIKPTGWEQERYSNIPGESLYQRCHLIGNQLGGAEIYENMVTGTQYLNVSGMLPVENSIVDYIKRTKNHVQYSVFPYYVDNNLVCSGVVISAKSIEDDSINLLVYCHNVQSGVSIDYATGKSKNEEVITRSAIESGHYILNTNRRRFHLPTCKSVNDISSENREEYSGSRESLIEKGYKPCGNCKP